MEMVRAREVTVWSAPRRIEIQLTGMKLAEMV